MHHFTFGLESFLDLIEHDFIRIRMSVTAVSVTVETSKTLVHMENSKTKVYHLNCTS